MSRRIIISLLVIFALWAFVVRLLPHAANMTPVGALAIFAGVYLPRRWGWLVPISVLLVSDAWLGGYELPVMLSVYGSFAAIAFFGSFFRTWRPGLQVVLFSPLISSTLFFLVTNFAVWAATPWYAKTIEGLLISYTLAIPFWRNMFVGDVFYTAAFFGIVIIVTKASRFPTTYNLQPTTYEW